ncbi:trichohyalin-like [Odontomachus brunneus]|uniref:trichohyalin-like n=1 Tax=Odontomachus brunneus TaxID=486640 RepID=UPI0013F29C20|nr:trichohyalin-like [Odontomachus brunneus]
MRERANSLSLIDAFKRGEKRKEMEEIQAGIFKKSVKVMRSPEKQTEKQLGKQMETQLVEQPEKQVEERMGEILREVREGFKEVKAELREVKEGRTEMREWMEEMRRRLDSLEKRVEEMEKDKGGEEKEEECGEKKVKEKIEQLELGRKGEMKEVEERMKRLELEGEKRKREERKRNIIVKGVKAKEEGIEGLRKEIEEIVGVTGAVVRVEGMRSIGYKNKEGREMVWVRLASVGEKIEVMKGKAKLRERGEWIVDDLTEKERRIEWWIKREAERNRREGRRLRVGYMKTWIEGKLWVWDEFRDELREWKGKEVREERKGWERVKEWLPKGYMWEMQEARRRNKKG